MEVLRDLPYDVVIDILTRLPVKTLIRFRCVCKTWCDIIMDSSFSTLHIHQSTKFQNYTGQNSKGSRTPYHNQLSLRLGDIFVGHEILEFPFITFQGWNIKIAGSCNGLICFTHPYYYGHDIYLWNPSIRKLKALPSPRIHPSYVMHMTVQVHGFGFDCRTDDFKVVRILYLDANYIHKFNVNPCEIEVYSLSTNSWKRIATIVPCFTTDILSHAFFNGAFHWSARKDGFKGKLIMSFDFANEEFREILPPNCYIEEHDFVFISEFQNSLSLLSWPSNSSMMSTCCVWVMEYNMTDSWTKHFTFNLQSSDRVQKPLGIAMNGKVLLKRHNRQLISYDPETQQINDLGIHAWDAVTYMESLALLKEGRKQFVGRQSLWEKIGTWGYYLVKVVDGWLGKRILNIDLSH